MIYTPGIIFIISRQRVKNHASHKPQMLQLLQLQRII